VRLGALNNDKLLTLDRWFFEELPGAIAARVPRHMTAAELVLLVDWKMTRGKVRPRLLEFARAHSEGTVRDATAAAIAVLANARGGGGGRGRDVMERESEGGSVLVAKSKSRAKAKITPTPPATSATLAPALATRVAAATTQAMIAVEDIPSALAPLVALKGMGPATSSAVLAAADASIPFMSDDVMAVALPPSTGSSDTYSMPRLLQLAAKVRAKAAKVGLTAGEVERAVYSEAALTKTPKKDPLTGGDAAKKRKR